MIGPAKAALTATGLFIALQIQTGSELEAPFKITAGGEPIDVEIGHAAPFVTDFNGDGLNDLLIGQFGDGKLRIYLNTGTRRHPRFDGFSYFQAGGADGTIPAS